VVGALVAAALVSASAPAASTPTRPAAEAAPVQPIVRTDGVEGRMDTYASQVSGAQIWDLEVIGSTIYAAGKFTHVVDAGGAWPRIDQPFLAAFSTVTGEWVPSFRPRLNRPAYALDTLPSGALLVGGEFTKANNVVARGMVALNRTTGAIDTRFNAGVRRPNSTRYAVVRDFDVRGNQLYAVGNFGQATGAGRGFVRREKAARFDARTGAVNGAWHPSLAGPTAYAVAVSADGRRVHLGGEFASVNGRAGTDQIATVSVNSGALIGGWDHGSNAPHWPTWPVGGVVFDLAVYGNNLYLAGAEHYWERRTSDTGRSLKFRRITNDGQTVEVVGNRVYIGCHCYHRDPGHQLWEVNATTGQAYAGRTWSLQSGDGTWATAVAPDGCLWLGGDFSAATAVVGLGTGSFWVGRLARLCPAGAGAAANSEATTTGPVNPPGWHAP
jgi:hypothetical protein